MVDQKMHGEQAARNGNARSGRRKLLGIGLTILFIAITCAAFILGSSIGVKGQHGYISNLMAHQNSLVQENADLKVLNDVNESIIEGYREDTTSKVVQSLLEPIPIPPSGSFIVDENPSVVSNADPLILDDGSWIVGDDFEAGTYFSREATGTSCYWAIFSGENGPTGLIKNGLTDGAHSGVLLSDGQTFQTWGCGEWKPE